MKKSLSKLLLAAVPLALLPAYGVSTTPASATVPGYLTVMLAHSGWTLTDKECRPLANVVTLGEQATAYQTLGLSGITSTVVTSWVGRCIAGVSVEPYPKPIQVSSWYQLNTLASTYKWSFVSASRTYPNLNTLTWSQQRAEIVGSLTDLQAHGLPRTWGLFAYPNDHIDRSSELLVDAHYSFGRAYSQQPNTLPIPAPYLAKTHSLDGGACNDPTQPCYQYTTPKRYTPPDTLASWLAPGSGIWSIVQGYRFVTGAGSNDSTSWDCTSADWHQHTTWGLDPTEVYCWTDWLAALSRIPAGTVEMDPATLAKSVGR